MIWFVRNWDAGEGRAAFIGDKMETDEACLDYYRIKNDNHVIVTLGSELPEKGQRATRISPLIELVGLLCENKKAKPLLFRLMATRILLSWN